MGGRFLLSLISFDCCKRVSRLGNIEQTFLFRNHPLAERILSLKSFQLSLKIHYPIYVIKYSTKGISIHITSPITTIMNVR